MALIQCGECGELSSDGTGRCAKCGAKLQRLEAGLGRRVDLVTEKENSAPQPTPVQSTPDLSRMFAEVEPPGATDPQPPLRSSLLICPDCGHKVSRLAKACPNCGNTALTQSMLYIQIVGKVMALLILLILLKTCIF